MWTVLSRRRKPKRSLVESRVALQRVQQRDEKITQVAEALDRHMAINHLGDGFDAAIRERRA